MFRIVYDVTTPMSSPPEPLVELNAPVLSVRDLRVQFRTDRGTLKAADGVSFDLGKNEVIGIVGESGSGKTVTALSVLALLPTTAKATGEVLYGERNLLGLKEPEIRAIRGKDIAMVFQDALAALNPLHRVGNQISEAITVHNPKAPRKEVKARVLELLGLVGIPNPKERANEYPHEYSGGMRQRAMIAMAIANDPQILIADEPTTALDVTTQAQVLEVLQRVRERTGSAMIIITHDLGVVAGVADRILVMYAGRIVESGTVDDVFHRPSHPYTLGLLASLPRLDREGGRRLPRIAGQPPSLVDVPSGCSFHPRCPFAKLPEPCSADDPQLLPTVTANHLSACHFSDEVARAEPGDRAWDVEVVESGGGSVTPAP
ncbi:MAG TPA: ABC transporter ATP-binding protein [Acidimicrobiales bacterium]|nr:ABC transporter ATP-binding protein [Acidimicrobiales bacterium]